MSCRRDVLAVKGCMRSTLSGSEGCAEATTGSSRSVTAREGKEKEMERRVWGSTERRRREGSAATQCGQNDDHHRARRKRWKATRRGAKRRGEKPSSGGANRHDNLVEMETEAAFLFTRASASSRQICTSARIATFPGTSRNSNKHHYLL
ncbi:unnamed protein product [Lasius platythorax]|uniref:Uncharacterized protein n=1 Tax=Lasius platythorax TaxID=488582 RepID=A0AAV2NXC9_9HYME